MDKDLIKLAEAIKENRRDYDDWGMMLVASQTVCF